MASNEDIVNEHIRAVLASDIDALVEGYADDIILIVGPEPVIGKDAIRTMFASFPEGALPNEITVDFAVHHGEYSFVKYHHLDGTRGGDTFRIRDGKIVMQTAHLVTD